MQQQNLNFHRFQVGETVHIPIQNYPERKFQINKLLGNGVEGTVFSAQAFNWDQNQQYAIKIHKTPQSEKYISFVDSLIKYQSQCENPLNSTYYPTYIIRTYEQFFINQNVLVIIMELGDMDLFQLQKSNANINLQTIGNYCIQMAKSIQFLHQYQYIHRDIKPENYILVGQQIKLIDFGLIKKNNNNFQNTIYVVTPLFQAPELATGKADYTQTVDIWSLGCVFYELIKKEELFLSDSFNETTQLIISHLADQNYVYSKINSLQISEVWKSTILQMLNPLPQNRPKIQDVVQKIEKNNIAFNIPFQANFSLPNQNNKNINFNTQINIHNPNFNQNICFNINNLISTFQSQNLINQIKQNFLTKQLLEKLLESSKEVLNKYFSNGNQLQRFDEEVKTSCLNIQDKIAFVKKLLQEIEKDQNFLNQTKNLMPEFLELHSKQELHEQSLQEMKTSQQDEQKLKQNFKDEGQNVIIETQDSQQKQLQDENQKVQQHDKMQENVRNQQIKIQQLQIKLQQSRFLEELQRKNMEEIEQLEKSIDEKQYISQQLNQSTIKLSELKIQQQILNNQQLDLKKQQQEIHQVEGEIQILQQQGEQLLNELDIKKQLNIKLKYLNQKIAELQTQKQDIDSLNNQLNEQLDEYYNEVQIYIKSKEMIEKTKSEISESQKQLQFEKAKFLQAQQMIQFGEEQIKQLMKEVETKKEQIQKLQQQQDLDLGKLISENQDLDQQLSQQKVIQQQYEKQYVLSTEPQPNIPFNTQTKQAFDLDQFKGQSSTFQGKLN